MNSQNIRGIATGASFGLVEIPTNSWRQFDQTSWPYVPSIHTIVLIAWGITKVACTRNFCTEGAHKAWDSDGSKAVRKFVGDQTPIESEILAA